MADRFDNPTTIVADEATGPIPGPYRLETANGELVIKAGCWEVAAIKPLCGYPVDHAAPNALLLAAAPAFALAFHALTAAEQDRVAVDLPEWAVLAIRAMEGGER